MGSRSREISFLNRLDRSSGPRHHNAPLIRFRVPPLCQIGLNAAVKYLLRIRQVALASFHFTCDTQDKFREEKEREMRDDERVREEDKERNVGKRRKQLTASSGNVKMFCYLNICLHNLNGSFGTQLRGGPNESVALCPVVEASRKCENICTKHQHEIDSVQLGVK